MFRFSKVKKKKLQEAAVNKFFASWLRGWCDGIVRGLVPKKPKPRRLVPTKTKTIWRTQVRKFHFSSICNVLPCELRLFWYSTRVLNQQSADKRPTVGRLLAEKAVNDSRPTVVQLSADSRPTVGRQFFGGAVLHFFQIICSFFSCKLSLKTCTVQEML